jgi:acetyltransferase-like isoleucine patch superfamily enzyme
VKNIFNILYFLIFGGVRNAKRLGVTVGDNCRILGFKFGSEPFLISIGNNVTITSGVRFVTHDGSTWLIRDSKGRRYSFNKIQINDNVFIGINSIILPGVLVDNDVIIGAGSVVTKSVPKGSIVAGNPAKIIGNFYDYKEKALNSFYSDIDLNNDLNYKEKITNLLDRQFKPYLKNAK